jgi:hypothetical protein
MATLLAQAVGGSRRMTPGNCCFVDFLRSGGIVGKPETEPK